jgi:hypothetical protein
MYTVRRRPTMMRTPPITCIKTTELERRRTCGERRGGTKENKGQQIECQQDEKRRK